MSAKHRDPNRGSSVRALTPRLLKAQATPQSSRATDTGSTSPGGTTRQSGSGGGATGLIVTRELYKVLDQERQKHRSPARHSSLRGGGHASRPNFIVCYLCGQEFSSGSLPIHQPQCYVKKLIEWERMSPPRRGLRPVDPETHEKQAKERVALVFEKELPGDGKKTDKYHDCINSIHLGEYNTRMLSKCENCGRTFLPESLVVHQRSCKPGASSASKPVSRLSMTSTKFQGTTGSMPRKTTPRRPGLESCATVSNDEKSLLVSAANTTARQGIRATSLAPETPSKVKGAEKEEEKVGFFPSTVEEPVRGTLLGVCAGLPSGEGCVVDDVGSSIENITPIPKELQTSVNNKKLTESGNVVDYNTPRAAESARVARKETLSSDRASTSASEARNENVYVVSSSVEENLLCGVSTHIGDSQVPDNEISPGKRTAVIPMNNVSRFKNVSSRLQLDRQAKKELPRCRYCNRTFNAERLSKHESVCLERNKPPQKTSASVGNATISNVRKTRTREIPQEALAESSEKKRPVKMCAQPSQPTVTKTTTTMTANVTSGLVENTVTSQPKTNDEKGESDEPIKRRFCFECGAKLNCERQRFCAECGTKLL